jgi:ATP-dependent RNA helicase DeaD
MPPPIARLAEKVLKDPVRIDLTTGVRYAKDVEQRFAVIEDRERADAVARLIDAEEPEKAIIFCRTKIETDNLANVLAGRGIAARALHGDIEQSERQRVLRNFRAGTTDVLVATDVAARGLDIADVSHVINYHLPFDQDAYVHRIGRTGRAGKKGVAITLVTAYEFHGLRRIQQAIKATFIPSEIPTLHDVRKRVGSRVLAEAMKHPISDEAVELFAALCSEVDVTEAACHLLSMLLATKQVQGPENIGMRAEQAKKLAEGQGGGNRPRYGGGGGGYRGGGGGYRGGSGGGGYRGRGGPPPRGPR